MLAGLCGDPCCDKAMAPPRGGASRGGAFHLDSKRKRITREGDAYFCRSAWTPLYCNLMSSGHVKLRNSFSAWHSVLCYRHSGRHSMP